MKALLITLLTLTSFQTFADTYTACYSQEEQRNLIVVGIDAKKGNALCVNVYLKETEKYAEFCNPQITGSKYKVSGRTLSGVVVNAEVDLKTGKANIQGKNLTLSCN